jgi:hypothetical protein
LLQVSGIGGREVLEAAGVGVKVELEGVGEGYVDHGFVVSVGSGEFLFGFLSYSALRNKV